MSNRMKKRKRSFGQKKKYIDHVRSLEVELQQRNREGKTTLLSLMSEKDAQVLYNPDGFNKDDIFTQVFSGKINKDKTVKTNLLGCEDLLKIKGQFELLNSFSFDTNQMIDNVMEVAIVVTYKYRKIKNPLFPMLVKSFKYSYLNSKYTNFSKRSKEEQDKLLSELDENNGDYTNESKKYIEPFIKFLESRIYNEYIGQQEIGEEMEEERQVTMRYNVQTIASQNDSPHRIYFKVYCIKPIDPIYVNYVLSGWDIELYVDQKATSYYNLHLKALLLDNYQSYENRKRNLKKVFEKSKALFIKIREQNIGTFPERVKKIEETANKRVEEGVGIEKNQVGYIYRKIRIEKLFLSYSDPFTDKINVIFDNAIRAELFGTNFSNWTMRIQKLSMTLYLESTINIPLKCHIILNSWNPTLNKVNAFTLLTEDIYPNNFKENTQINTLVINFSSLYFKNATDKLLIVLDKQDNITQNVIVKQAYLKYIPIINLNGKVSDDKLYYPFKHSDNSI